MRYQTRAVLAGAYRGRDRDGSPRDRHLLTHVLNTDTGLVLCRGVYSKSLADEEADDVAATPTCTVCARKDPRRVSSTMEG